MNTPKPYTEQRNGNIIYRNFSQDIDESELIWHRDKEDRYVKILNESDWGFQMDNELPIRLTKGTELFIPKETYHRVLKGRSDLNILIKENTTKEEMEISKKDLIQKKLKEDAEDANFMGEITKGELEEAKKKKGDRCTRIAKRKYDVWPSAYACVPESSSKALTRDGWKTVDELNIGEEILTYNINTDKLEFKPILNLHRYKDTKTNVVRSGNNGFVFEATDNHKWVVKLDETKGKRAEKYERINDKALIETKDLLLNKHNKHLVVTAPYDGGEKIKKDKIYKYGDNWVKYILDISDEQRQTWLFSAIVYDGHQKKIERLTENKEQINELDWIYTGPYNKQSFDFKQKDVEHRDAFLLSAFLNNGMVSWKKHNTKNIYSCYYTSNKRFKNTSNFKLVKENNTDVWCPETENGTWVMMQETEGCGIITTTGNSGAVVKCRQGKIWKGLNEEEDESLDNYNKELIKKAHDAITRRKGKDYAPDVHEIQAWIDNNIESLEEKWSEKYKRSIDCNNPKGFSQKAHCKGRLKEEEESMDEKTDFSKEKSKGLHGWFERQGGSGKSKGWVDCNTCRTVDGKKKCKTCGRQEGEKRSKYPACRPTPSACSTKGKGKSWGKKSANEEFPIQSLYREKENMEIRKRDMFDEDLILKRNQDDGKIYVQSDLSDERARSQETFKNKEALKRAGFSWDGRVKAWSIDDSKFSDAKNTIESVNKKEYLINKLEELEEILFDSEAFDGKNNLMDKIDLYINDLANATDEAAVSAEIRRYLTFFSKFRGHSMFNTWLIYIQSRGKATKVAGFRQWEKKFFRRVKKGAKGLTILVPIISKSSVEDETTGEEITKQNVTRFKPGYVFDISDTEPIDERGEIPEEPKWYVDLEPTERSIELYKYFIELCEDLGIEITKADSKRGEKGYSAGNKINISSAKEGAGEVSTLVHEVAHELMHWRKSSIYYQENTDAQLRELQAESVSYVVLKHYDLPTEHHPTYLALWKANKDKIKSNLKVITDVASFIISEIDKIERRYKKDDKTQNVLSESRNVLLKRELEKEIKLGEIKDVFKRYMGKL